MHTDRRTAPRWSPAGSLSSHLMVGARPIAAPIVELSAAGARLATYTNTKARRVVLSIGWKDADSGEQREFLRSGAVARRSKRPTRHCYFSFDSPLSKTELSLITKFEPFPTTALPPAAVANPLREEHARPAEVPANDGPLDLVRQDYTIVNDEIRGIQSCRSNVFMATLGASAAGAIALIGIVARGVDHANLWWFSGGLVMWFLLLIAIGVMIEKARALNCRFGFLAALADYLRDGVAPAGYLGWAHLKANRHACRARNAASLCTDGGICWTRERGQYRTLTSRKHVVANIFSSFTAFSAVVFGSLYALGTLALIAGTLRYLPTVTPTWTTPLAFSAGAISLVIGLRFYAWLKGLRKGKHSVEAYYLTWCAALRHCRPIAG